MHSWLCYWSCNVRGKKEPEMFEFCICLKGWSITSERLCACGRRTCREKSRTQSCFLTVGMERSRHACESSAIAAAGSISLCSYVDKRDKENTTCGRCRWHKQRKHALTQRTSKCLRDVNVLECLQSSCVSANIVSLFFFTILNYLSVP